MKDEYEDGPEHRHDEPRGLSRRVDPSDAAEESSEKRPRDSKEHGEDAAAGVSSRQEQLRDDARDQTENDPAKYAIEFHTVDLVQEG